MDTDSSVDAGSEMDADSEIDTDSQDAGSEKSKRYVVQMLWCK
jgi:hypothetical protein